MEGLTSGIIYDLGCSKNPSRPGLEGFFVSEKNFSAVTPGGAAGKEVDR